MEGKLEHPTLKGIMPQSFEYIFNQIQKDSNHKYTVTVSYVQIYMETISDLLDDKKQNLKIKEVVHSFTRKKIMMIEGNTWILVENAEDCLKVLSKGSEKRNKRKHLMNEESCRSNAIFICRVQKEPINENVSDDKSDSFLYFVDLAGSEKKRKTKAGKLGEKEDKMINLSLLTLSNCIDLLAKGKDIGYRYKDSKLTMLLKDSFGVNSKTSLIVNLSPSSNHTDESYFNLIFADRAKSVKTITQTNKKVMPIENKTKDLQSLLEQAEKEIELLKEENNELREEIASLKEDLLLKDNEIESINNNRNVNLKSYNERIQNPLTINSFYKTNVNSCINPFELSEQLNKLEQQFEEERTNHQLKTQELKNKYNAQLEKKDQMIITLNEANNQLQNEKIIYQNEYDKHKQLYSNLVKNISKLNGKTGGTDLETYINDLSTRDENNRIDNSIIAEYIEKADKEIKHLTERNEECSSYEQYNDDIENIETEIKALSKYKVKLTKLQDKDIDEYNKTKLYCEKLKLENTISLLKTKNEILKETIKTKKDKLTSLKNANKEIKKGTNCKEHEMNVLLKKNNDLLNEISKLEFTIQENQNTIDNKEQQIKNLTNNINEKESKIEEYIKQIDSYYNKNVELSQQIIKLKRELNEMEAIQTELKAIKGKNILLKSNITKQNKHIENVQLEKQKLNIDLYNIENEYSIQKDKIAQCEKEYDIQLKQYKNELKQKNKQLETIENKFTSTQNVIDNLHQENKQMKELLMNVQQKYEEQNKELQMKVNENERLQNTNKSLNLNIQELKSKKDEYELEMERMDKTINTQLKEINDMKEDIDVMDDEVKQLKTENKKQELLLDKKDQQLELLNKHYLEMHNNYNNDKTLPSQHEYRTSSDEEDEDMFSKDNTINKIYKEKNNLEKQLKKLNEEYLKQNQQIQKYEKIIQHLQEQTSYNQQMDLQNQDTFYENLLQYMNKLLQKKNYDFACLRIEISNINRFISDNHFPIDLTNINTITSLLQSKLESYINEYSDVFNDVNVESYQEDIINNYNLTLTSSFDELIKITSFFVNSVPIINNNYNDALQTQKLLKDNINSFIHLLPETNDLDVLKYKIQSKVDTMLKIKYDFADCYKNVSNLVETFNYISVETVKCFVNKLMEKEGRVNVMNQNEIVK